MNTTNVEKKSIYQKLLEVQKELEPVTKGKDNPYFKSKYADINVFIDMVKPVLNKHGLLLLQPLTTLDDGTPAIATVLVDSDDGDSFTESKTPVIFKDSDPQKFGSAVTYMRRYALQSFLFIQAEDDDGNKASDKVTDTEKEKIQKMEKHEEAIANITDMEELKSYYKANEGDGKDFAKLVTARKKELQELQVGLDILHEEA